MIWSIRQRRTFQTLARSGRSASSESLWCTFLNDPAAVPLRVAFAVGRSVGTATRRNRLRRQLRAIVVALQPELGLNHGWLLIGATPAASERTFQSLCNETDLMLRRAMSNPSAPRRGRFG